MSAQDLTQDGRYCRFFRRQHDNESEPLCPIAENADFRRCKRRVRDDERREAPIHDENEMVRRIWHALLQQRCYRHAHHTSCFGELPRRVPTGNCEDTIRSEMAEENAPTLNCIEAILGEGKSPCSGRRPSVDHAHLNEIEVLLTTREPASTVVNEKPHPSKVRKMVVFAKPC